MTSCAIFLEQFAANGTLVTAYYSHLIPVAIALLLSVYSLLKTKFSKLAVFFFLFTFSFSIWLIGDLITWVTPAYPPIIFVWSWLDFSNIVFFVLGAYFFSALAQDKISNWKKVIYILLCIPAFAATVAGLSIVDFNQPVCEAINNNLLTNYKLFVEGFVVILMFATLVLAWKKADARRRIQLSVILTAILLFFGVFAGTEYVASTTGIYEINLYSLFVLPLFLMILTFAITDLRLFQLRFVGTQILAYVLVILVGSQLLFITDSTSRNLTLVTFVMSLIMGILLIENARREAQARVRIEELAGELSKANTDLEHANERQVTLIHFITHQIKGFVSKSRNIFASIQEGDYGAVPESMKPLLKEGFDSDTRGAATIQEILNASNIKSGKVTYDMKPLDLKALVEGIVKDLKPNAAAKNLALNTDFGADAVTITGDGPQLVNAFKNIIDNSIKYTLAGSVNLSIAPVKDKKVLFTIQDTGIGITPEDMKNLFTEGGHGKESIKINVDSTGFGLYIVKSIIEAHHGRVWAESDGAGKGSRFLIELPV